MTTKDKSQYIIFTLIIFITSAIILSMKTPFTGDEFYTLDIEKIHKPLLYKIIISGIIKIFNPISSDHVLILRLSSLIFSTISILLWFIYYIKNKNQAFIFSILIITSGFLLRETIFFRYYSFYFMTSTITFLVLLQAHNLFSVNQKLLIGFIGFILSPYLFFVLNGLQYFCYFLYILIFEKIRNARLRLSLIISNLIIFCCFLIYPKMIWWVFNWINIMDHAAINLSSTELRGFTISTIVKPFYAIYQMIFGYDIIPTELIIIAPLFILISGIFLFLFYNIFQNNNKIFLFYLSIFIMPFLLIFYFFEAITLPGFLQMDTRHGMLFYPLIISSVLLSTDYLSNSMRKIFINSLIFSQVIGVVNAHKEDKCDWSLISEKTNSYVEENKCRNILLDGRSSQPFKFYNKNPKINNLIQYTWGNEDSIKTWLHGRDNIILLLNDYKSYTNLSLKQNWNSGESSYGRVSTLENLLTLLNKKYYLIDSYINYPTFFYYFEKKDEINSNIISSSVWEYQLKDLILPLSNPQEKQLVSSVVIESKNSITVLADSLLVLNLENSNHIDSGEIVGSIQIGNEIVQLIKGENIWDLFSDYYNEILDESSIFFQWDHKPLVSGSISYPGSYLKHKANIYSLKLNNPKNKEVYISNLVEKADLRVWIFKKT